MPPLPAVAGVVRVALLHTLETNPQAVTRFYIHYSGTAPAVSDLSTFNGSIATAYGANLAALLSSNCLLTAIDSADLTSATGSVSNNVVSVAGTRAGTTLPANDCLVTSYSIARRYRGGHPRGYWPLGVAADLANNRNWLSSFVTTCNTDMAAFFTAIFAAGWAGAGTLTHVNVSYFSGFHVVTNPITGRARNVPLVRGVPLQDNVTGVRTQASVGSQRRRIQFVD